MSEIETTPQGIPLQLTARQRAALAALMCEPTIEAAAKRAHVSERTLQRWLYHDALFAAELRAAQAQLMDTAIRRLAGGAAEALDTIAEIMRDKSAPVSVRLRAADTTLQRLFDLKQLAEYEERIARLETLARDGAV